MVFQYLSTHITVNNYIKCKTIQKGRKSQFRNGSVGNITTIESDITISDGNWFQVLIVQYDEKFALINDQGDMGLLICNICRVSLYNSFI